MEKRGEVRGRNCKILINTDKKRFETPGTGKGRVYMVKCPVCLWSHILFKTGKRALEEGKPIEGQKGWFNFEKGDIETAPFIDVRDGSQEQGKGMNRIEEECLSLREAMKKEEYKELISSLKNQLQKIQKILENQSNK